jgi:GT2 family glycosyltransferase
MKTLTTVVLNWNGAADTVALLSSLERSRVPLGWRLRTLVVDNASTDGSPEKITAAYPSVEMIRNPSNLRFAGGNNPGIRHALESGADAVMLLNNDTEVDPAMIERLLLALEQDPSAGAASPLVYFGPPSNRIWYAGGRLMPWLGHASHRGLRERDEGQYRAVEPTGYLTGCCLLATAAAWKRVGLLDERYFIYAEDADWSLRARAAGFRLLFVPTARLWHKVSASTGAASPFKIYQRLRANLTLFGTHARGLARLTWLPAFLLQQKALMAWLLIRGHGAAARAVPSALWDALRGKPAGEMRW